MSLKESKKQHFEPIAVVGIGSIFPGALNPSEFWDNIKQSRDFIQDILPSHWLVEDYYDPDLNAVDKTYCKRGAFLSTIDFDPMEYGIPPSVLPAIDTCQLIALMVAKQTLQDAYGEGYKTLDLNRVSVIIGSSTLEAIQYMAGRLQRPIWAKALREQGLPESQVTEICEKIANHYTPLQENTFPGLLQNVIAGRIANRFNLGGTNCTTDAACASSLAALTMSVRELQAGASDMVITGGVDTLNDIVMYMCFAQTKALSLSGDCAPFSDKADGTVLGEGLGLFALKRLSDAEKEGNKIYGVIRGIGTSSDGRSKSIYAPLPQGQSKAINRAYEVAGYSISTVELLEAHGTGTKAGDLAEFQGMEMAFKAAGETRAQVCALGSIKSQIGHTKSAAGAAGMFKALMALHHKTLPPTIKVDQPNPAFDLAHSPLYLNTATRPWVRNSEHPRRASVSSFGFGGSNYHVTLEEYQDKRHRAPRLRTFPSELVVFSAKDSEQLVVQVKTFLQTLNDQTSLAQLAYHTQTNLHAGDKARLAIIASDVESLRIKLQQAISSIQTFPDQPIAFKQGIYYAANKTQPGKVMFMFPGQGSQYVGMGADIAMSFDICMSAWDKASEIMLDDQTSLQDVVFPKPGFSPDQQQQNTQRIMATEWAQPALAVSSLSYLHLLEALGVKADYVCGHSFGELTALYAAGVMDEETLILLARRRGELMREAAKTKGAMLSVLYPVDDVLKMLQAHDLTATPANFNSPAQLVLSGTVQEIEEAQHYFVSQKIRCQRLQVATGFHSHLVESSCAPLHHFLSSLHFKKPTLPVFANTTAQVYPDNIGKIKEMLAQQLAHPVRFWDQIEHAYEQGVRTFIEVGPKNVLTSLVGRCLEKRPFHAIHLDKEGDNGVHALWHALGEMFSVGVNLNMKTLWEEYDTHPILETSSAEPKFTVKINGTNYAKPYPAGSAAPVVKTVVEAATKTVNISVPQEPAGNTAPSISGKPQQQQETHIEEVTPMSQNNNAYLIQMFQQLQMQLIQSHNHYQKVMAESHIAFLQSISQLANQAGGEPAAQMTLNVPFQASQAQAIQPPVIEEVVMPFVAPTPVYANGASVNGMSMAAAPVSAPVMVSAPAPVMAAPAPLPAAQVIQPAVQVQPVPVVETPQPVMNGAMNGHAAPVVRAPENIGQPRGVAPTVVSAPGSSDKLESLLLDVVVETTGYPKEMLNMNMSIEADLGIDSIKRVEILSILVERAPDLPQVDPADLGKLETLGHIISYMKERQGK